MVKLSKRLQTIADYVPDGSRLGDIGSDHALLPVFLAERGRVSFAVAGELNPGPLEAAARQVREAGVGDRVFVRGGDGLRVVKPGEVDVVTIAGMGGALIVQILTEGADKLESVAKLVLQPNVAGEQVRRWLAANGWLLEAEQIVEEDGKFYEVMSAVRSPEAAARNEALYAPRILNGLELASDELFRFGPYLLEQADDAFLAKWEAELSKLNGIMSGLAKGGTAAAEQRKAEFAVERDRIREVILCLQTHKRSSN